MKSHPRLNTPESPRLDPAEDAAALLRRFGFAMLVLAVPVAGLVSRRAAVVLAPLGVALLVIAAIIDGASPPFLPTIRRVLTRPEGIATLVLAGWAALSLAWTPFVPSATEKLMNLVGAGAMAVVGAAVLPERMRSSNLYLMTVGTGAAVLFALGLSFSGLLDGDFGIDDDGGSLERGLVILAVFLWPAIGWLMSRGRMIEALVLAAGAFAAALLGPSRVLGLVILLGGLAFGIAALRRREGPGAIGMMLAGLILIAPALPFLLRPATKAIFGVLDPVTLSVRVWADVVRIDPFRLITGHGLDAAFRGRFVGILPVERPTSLLFEIWYDLGLVGACALAAALYWTARRLGQAGGPLMPAKIASLTTAFALSAVGLGGSQAWWVTTLTLVALAFVAAERGQFRTSRPKARSGPKAANDR